MIDFTSIEQMVQDTHFSSLPLWENVMVSDCERQGISREESWHRMSSMLTAMVQADCSYQESDRSHSGLSGGDGGKMARYAREQEPLCGPFLTEVMAGALRMGECNACMKRIVAAPTAGSSGVLPAMLFACQEIHGFTDQQLHRALANAAAIGYLIARNATVSGAEGGCQAEVGAASAMAASAAVELMGGTPRQCFAAAANALAGIMGLVCDPIAGLVEAPCQKRNATGVANALVSAQMALAGIENLVSFDETVAAMYAVGRSLPFELRESALGGLAATPSARACSACAGCR